MGIVYLFGQTSEALEVVEASVPDNDNLESAKIIGLIPNPKIARGVPARNIYKQVETLLVVNGVDFDCDKVRSDFKIITFLVQGMMDRVDGVLNSDRCLLLDTLRLALAYEEPVEKDDTQELFGDLLGHLD